MSEAATITVSPLVRAARRPVDTTTTLTWVDASGAYRMDTFPLRDTGVRVVAYAARILLDTRAEGGTPLAVDVRTA